MRDIRKLISVTLPAVILCFCAATGRAQETGEKDADHARNLLLKGQEQFQAKEYKAAQATLMTAGAAWDALPEEQRKQRNELLDQAGPAAKKQAAAEEALSAGQKALEAGRLADAENAFKEAADSTYLTDARRTVAMEQLALARQRLAAASQPPRADTPTGPAGVPVPAPEFQEGDILGDVARIIKVKRETARFDINEADKRAREILAKAATAAEFDAASAAASQAENVLNANKGVFPPDDARQLLDKIEELKRYVELRRAAWERKVYIETRIEIDRKEKERQIGQEDALRRQIAQYSADAQVAIRRKDYKKALELLDKVLKIAPEDHAARDLRAVVEQIELLQREKGYATEEAYQRQQSLIEIREAEIPWYELLRYPKDWREITQRREPFMASAGTESEQNRAALQKLKRKLTEARFDNQKLVSVIEWLQVSSGLSIHVKWSALETAGISKETTNVTAVRLTDVSVEKVLRTVLDDVGGTMAQLSYVVDEGVVTISTKADLSGPTYRKTLVYDIRDLIVTVPSFNGPRMDFSIGSGNNQTTGSNNLFGDNNDNNNDNGQNRAAMVAGIMGLIANTIDKESWMTPWGTGTVGSLSELSGQLVVTQTPENHRALLDLINQLREAKALQINIECRFLTVSTGFLNSVGLDLQTYLNIGSSLGGWGYMTDPITGASVPIRGASTWKWLGHKSQTLSNNLTPFALRTDTKAFATGGLSSPISGGIASIGSLVGSPALSVGGTFLDDIQVDFLVDATQATTLSRAVTAPRLTIFNGQRAYVTFGSQQAYVSELEPVVDENVVAYRATVSFVPTGTVLDVEGTVSADRRYVVMTVRPQVAQLLGFTNYFTTVTGTDGNGGATTGTGFIQLPNVMIEALETTVSVPDGGTLLLGGQKASGEMEKEKGVPLLSKIPILNRLFTNRAKVRDEQTILILIKPRIIIQSEEETKAFP